MFCTANLTSNYILLVCHLFVLTSVSASTEDSRKFFLDRYATTTVFCVQLNNLNQKKKKRRGSAFRSVYDLVAAYPQLALTDSKLLGWYLRLSPEDRKLIQGMCRYSHYSSPQLALPLTRADAALVFAIRETYCDLMVDENCSKLFKTQTV